MAWKDDTQTSKTQIFRHLKKTRLFKSFISHRRQCKQLHYKLCCVVFAVLWNTYLCSFLLCFQGYEGSLIKLTSKQVRQTDTTYTSVFYIRRRILLTPFLLGFSFLTFPKILYDKSSHSSNLEEGIQYVCVFVCICGCVYWSTFISLHVCKCVFQYLCLYVCWHCIHVLMPVLVTMRTCIWS